MENELYRQIIENYIQAYNNFETDRMLEHMHEQVLFVNISGGAVNLTTHGITELRNQAQSAKRLFSSRRQTVVSLRVNGNEADVDIEFEGILAVDFPDGRKAGSEIKLKGKSIFKFDGDKIIELKDIS